MQIKSLDEQDFGLWDGMSDADCKEAFIKDYEERQFDQLRYRYPRGESYTDVIARIEPIIFELERQAGPIIIIGHEEVLKCLYVYFCNAPIIEIPSIKIPSNSIIKFVPVAYGFSEERVVFDENGCMLKCDRKESEHLLNFPMEKTKNFIEEKENYNEVDKEDLFI